MASLGIPIRFNNTPVCGSTTVSARAMGLDRDSGTIEVGKRADLILIQGDPLANISDLRKVSQVVANGRLYETGKLWRSVGFQATTQPLRPQAR